MQLDPAIKNTQLSDKTAHLDVPSHNALAQRNAFGSGPRKQERRIMRIPRVLIPILIRRLLAIVRRAPLQPKPPAAFLRGRGAAHGGQPRPCTKPQPPDVPISVSPAGPPAAVGIELLRRRMEGWFGQLVR
jgi:hypothetical protein